MTSQPGDPDSRLLHILALRGEASAPAIADELGISVAQVRKRLAGLRAKGSVEFVEHGGNVGRPVRLWRTTVRGARRVPDAHANLAVELLEATRRALGARALDEVVEALGHRWQRDLAREIPRGTAIGERVQILARLRDEAGYRAHVDRADDGSWLLHQGHCPILAAAEDCEALCGAELLAYRQVLGSGCRVTREAHVLRGDATCSFRIRGAGVRSPATARAQANTPRSRSRATD